LLQAALGDFGQKQVGGHDQGGAEGDEGEGAEELGEVVAVERMGGVNLLRTKSH